MALAMVVFPAYAFELWEPHLPGSDEGLAAGALPPPGFYFIWLNYTPTNYTLHGGGFARDSKGQYDPSQSNSQLKYTTAYIEGPALLWSTGCKFLGADYGLAIAQPFDMTGVRFGTSTNSKSTSLGGAVWTGSQDGTFNTILVPYILSWKFCDYWRVKTSLAIGFDDAMNSPESSLGAVTKNGSQRFFDKNGVNFYAWAGDAGYLIVPNIGISWLYHGWNLSADLYYGIQTKDTDVNYKSGDMFEADYTASYTCGKWTFGLGAGQAQQLSEDKYNTGKGYTSQPNSIEEKYYFGPLVGYNFGPISVMLAYNVNVLSENCVAGNTFMARFVIPLGNPCPLTR
jgi:hypothetical protein